MADCVARVTRSMQNNNSEEDKAHDQRHMSHAISNTMNTMRWQVELGHKDSSEPADREQKQQRSQGMRHVARSGRLSHHDEHQERLP